MLRQVLGGLFDWISESELLWAVGPKLAVSQLGNRKLGYEPRPKFLVLNSYNVPWHELPTIDSWRTAEMKVELHEARRAGPHLDIRFKIGGKVYDFANVKRTSFPELGRVHGVKRVPSHNLRYFDADKATFPPGSYGEGQMRTIWRGAIDIARSNREKIEFSVPEGPFRGRFCIRDTGNGWLLLRMREPELPWKDRMPFSGQAHHLEKAYAEPDSIIAEEKIDGANFMLVPGDRENVLISRRLNVASEPINRSDCIPQLKYLRFPAWAKGRTFHVEVVAHNGSASHTAGLLNSLPNRSRWVQSSHELPLRVYLWDVSDNSSYLVRRGHLLRVARYSPRVDLRRIGDTSYQLVAKRIVSPRLLEVPTSNRDTGQGPAEFASAIKTAGGEGAVLKRVDGGYYADVWIKDKRVETYDLTIVDANEGYGRHVGRLGALVAEDPRTGARTRVGTGFSDFQREWLWENRERVYGKSICVAGHEQTHNGVVRGPRFEYFHPEAGIRLADEQSLRDYADVVGVSPYAIKARPK